MNNSLICGEHEFQPRSFIRCSYAARDENVEETFLESCCLHLQVVSRLMMYVNIVAERSFFISSFVICPKGVVAGSNETKT